MTKLKELVPQYTSDENKNNKKLTIINWTAISKIMKRAPKECQDKWNTMQAKNMKKGPFAAEEDAFITQRVAEWGDNIPGPFVSLGKELGRPAAIIAQRWKLTLSKRV